MNANEGNAFFCLLRRVLFNCLLGSNSPFHVTTLESGYSMVLILYCLLLLVLMGMDLVVRLAVVELKKRLGRRSC
jgi:hypothetical protein